MFSFPNMFDFLAHELTRLSGRRFAFTFVFVGPLNYFFFRHTTIVSLPDGLLDVTKLWLPSE
jgi:hypothetical protein